MAANTTATAADIGKKVYGRVKDKRPSLAKAPLQNAIDFSERDRISEKGFSETLWLADESGITYGGSSTDLFALNDAVPGESIEVTAAGCEIVLKSQVTIKRLSTARQRGEQAFENMWTRIQVNNKNSIGKRVDISMMYGGDNVGVVSGSSGSSGAYAVTLTAASWLPLAFLGAKGARLDFYSSDLMTHRNPTTDVVVSSVAPSKTAPIVNITGLDAEVSNITGTDVIFFKGAKGNECDGLTLMSGLTGAETYLGLAANSYPDLWSGNPKAVGGNFSFAALQDAIMESQARGGGFSMYKLYIAHATWTTLAGDMNALRAIDSSYKTETTEFGQRRLRFYCGGAEVSIEPTLNMKQGEAVLMPAVGEADIKRLGSADVGFTVPGMNERYVHIIDNSHGVEMRCYSDQFLWNTAINSCIHFTGITHS